MCCQSTQACRDFLGGQVAFLTKYRVQMISVTLTIVLAVVIAALTLVPMSGEGIPGSDKLHHVLAFAALAFPLPLAHPGLVWTVILGVSAYGGLIEIIQPFFGRDADWGDFLADFVGAVVGGILGAWSGKWLRSRHWSSPDS
jgi:VanZ family protein